LLNSKEVERENDDDDENDLGNADTLLTGVDPPIRDTRKTR
jgi:hypothetical protein